MSVKQTAKKTAAKKAKVKNKPKPPVPPQAPPVQQPMFTMNRDAVLAQAVQTRKMSQIAIALAQTLSDMSQQYDAIAEDIVKKEQQQNG